MMSPFVPVQPHNTPPQRACDESYSSCPTKCPPWTAPARSQPTHAPVRAPTLLTMSFTVQLLALQPGIVIFPVSPQSVHPGGASSLNTEPCMCCSAAATSPTSFFPLAGCTRLAGDAPTGGICQSKAGLKLHTSSWRRPAPTPCCLMQQACSEGHHRQDVHSGIWRQTWRCNGNQPGIMVLLCGQVPCNTTPRPQSRSAGRGSHFGKLGQNKEPCQACTSSSAARHLYSSGYAT
jgi:hypothetical protein